MTAVESLSNDFEIEIEIELDFGLLLMHFDYCFQELHLCFHHLLVSINEKDQLYFHQLHHPVFCQSCYFIHSLQKDGNHFLVISLIEFVLLQLVLHFRHYLELQPDDLCIICYIDQGSFGQLLYFTFLFLGCEYFLGHLFINFHQTHHQSKCLHEFDGFLQLNVAI